MAGRLALVIGSNWGDRPALSYLPEAARRLARSLVSPRHGQCEPALPDGRSLLIDPTASELDEAVRAAFAHASELEATLIVAFTGHGVTDDGDYYLLAKDSPDDPDSQTAFLVGQRIKEFFRRYRRVDGVVLLLDTCESGHAADAAGRDWVNVVRATERRFEILTATGDEPAYGGCFTRTLDYLIRTGSAAAVDRLGCAEVQGPINELCPAQHAVHLSVNGTGASAADVSMWLALNAATNTRRAALDGTPAANVAARLIRSFEPTRSFQQLRDRLRAGHGVGLVGPAGCGKTALLVALAQPDIEPRIDGIWLGEPEHSVEQVVNGLSEQLTRTVDGFDTAVTTYRNSVSGDDWQSADAVERQLLGPLRLLGGPLWIVIDNANEEVNRRLVRRLVDLDQVRILCSGRHRADLPREVDVVEVEPAEPDELARFCQRRGLDATASDVVIQRSGGNWLTATLLADAALRERAETIEVSPTGLAGFYTAALRHALGSEVARPGQVTAVLAVLAVAGAGPVLPGSLLLAAAARLGGPTEMWQLHEIISLLSRLAVHGRATDGQELFGVLHPTISDFLWRHGLRGLTPATTHGAMADTIRDAAPSHRQPNDNAESEYAARAEAEHLWRSGRKQEAIESLRARESPIHAENRERWSEWHRRITAELGADHPLAFEAAAQQARAVAETGDRMEAVRLLRDLAEHARADLGATHRVALSVAQDLAYWTGEAIDAEEARHTLAELIPVLTSQCGELDPLTLTARHNLGVMTAKAGDPDGALDMFEALLPVRERVIGRRHIDTLRTRGNILYWRGEIGPPPPSFRDSRNWFRYCATRSGNFIQKRSLPVITRPCSWPRRWTPTPSGRHCVPSRNCFPMRNESSVATGGGPVRSAFSWRSGRGISKATVPARQPRGGS